MKYLQHKNELIFVALVVLLLIGLLAAVTQVVTRNNLIGDAQVISIIPAVETESFSGNGDISDDSAIWFNETDPSLSVIIGDNKDINGGIGVFDLTGKLIQFRPDGKIGNVDLRKNLPFGTEAITLVGANNRSNSSIALYKLDHTTRQLEPISGTRPTLDPNYGFCFYQSKQTNKLYAFVTEESGSLMEQYELVVNGNAIDAQKVRTLTVDNQSEGCVVDDDRAQLYVGGEDIGIWKYGAEPTDPGTRTLVDAVGNGHLTADVEGLAIATRPDGTGYLFASSQGNSTYAIYTLEGNNTFVKNFTIAASDTIDAVSETDGISVYFGNFNATFPKGLFVAHDANNTGGITSNYKFVPLHLIVDLDTTPTTSVEPIATTLIPVEDTSVMSDSPTTNFASATSLESDGNPVKIAYMKFDLSPFTEDTLISAKLRMRVTNTSASTQNIKNVANTSWTDTGITYNNRPTIGSTITTFPGGTINNWVEADITSGISGKLGQVVSLAIDSAGTDGFDFYSKDNSTNQPELVLTTQSAGTPTLSVPITTPTPTVTIPTVTPVPTATPTSILTTTPLPIQTLYPTADSFVGSDYPARNNGTSGQLESDGSPKNIVYMKFNLEPLTGKQLKEAILRMKVSNTSTGTQNIRLVSDTSWTETGITYNNRPSLGSVFTTFPGGKAGNVIDVNITAGLAGSMGRVVTLAVESTNSDGYAFASRNNSIVNDRVKLLLTVQ